MLHLLAAAAGASQRQLTHLLQQMHILFEHYLIELHQQKQHVCTAIWTKALESPARHRDTALWQSPEIHARAPEKPYSVTLPDKLD